MSILSDLKFPEMGLSVRQRMVLYRQLKRMLRIASLKESIQELARRARETRSGSKRAKACDLMLHGIERNISIGESLLTMAPSSECTILMIGERNGRLTESLDSLIYLLEAQAGIVGSIVRAAMYPTVLFLVTIGMYVGFESYMLPIIETIVSADKLPELTLFVAQLARFISNYWFILIAGFFLSGYGLLYSLPVWTSEKRDVLDQYPFYGTYRDLQSAIFMISLSSMQKAGASLDESIKQIRTLSSPWMKKHLDMMLWKLRKVDSASEALDVGLIPRDLMADVKIATKAGDLDIALEELGREAITDFKGKVNLLTDIITPLGLLLVANNIVLIGLAYYGAIMSAS